MKIFVTYHDDKLIKEFKLNELDSKFECYNVNANPKEYNINFLNKYYCELVTLYYMWKNVTNIDLIGLCHYRRLFYHFTELSENECQVFDVLHLNEGIYKHFVNHHGNKIIDSALIYLKNYNSKYIEYFLTSYDMVPFTCFIMHKEDLDKMCSFVFDILFSIDKEYNLNFNPTNYEQQNIGRSIAFLGERLVSAYILTNMNPVCLHDYRQTLIY